MKYYYLYRHVRLDKNEVFYVGIGQATSPAEFKTIKSAFRRAYDMFGRGKFWKNIAAKTDLEIEIIYISENFDFIKEKEKEFISLYKRKTHGGTLCNITEGGEGVNGYKHSDIKIQKIKKSSIERWQNTDYRNKHLKIVYTYDLGGNLISETLGMKNLAKSLNISRDTLKTTMRNSSFLKIGKYFSYKRMDDSSFVREEIKFKIENSSKATLWLKWFKAGIQNIAYVSPEFKLRVIGSVN